MQHHVAMFEQLHSDINKFSHKAYYDCISNEKKPLISQTTKPEITSRGRKKLSRELDEGFI